MTAALIDGKAIAADLLAETKAGVSALTNAGAPPPKLAVVLVGDDPASQVYVASKVKRAAELGVASLERRLPASARQDEVMALVAALSAEASVDGILVQLPLPAHIDPSAVLTRLDPAKDVDGLTAVSAGRLVRGEPGLRPCTPLGCVILAERALGGRAALAGADCVVIGRSSLVGKPAALLFLERDATVTVAHSKSRDLPALCRRADILIAAVGRPELVAGGWVKPGAVVIDVGITRIPAPEKGEGATRLVGDVAFEAARARARAITPVPGGVGPMTVACLMANTLAAARARRG